jgi:hypothetical protein
MIGFLYFCHEVFFITVYSIITQTLSACTEMTFKVQKHHFWSVTYDNTFSIFSFIHWKGENPWIQTKGSKQSVSIEWYLVKPGIIPSLYFFSYLPSVPEPWKVLDTIIYYYSNPFGGQTKWVKSLHRHARPLQFIPFLKRLNIILTLCTVYFEYWTR